MTHRRRPLYDSRLAIRDVHGKTTRRAQHKNIPSAYRVRVRRRPSSPPTRARTCAVPAPRRRDAPTTLRVFAMAIWTSTEPMVSAVLYIGIRVHRVRIFHTRVCAPMGPITALCGHMSRSRRTLRVVDIARLTNKIDTQLKGNLCSTCPNKYY